MLEKIELLVAPTPDRCFTGVGHHGVILFVDFVFCVPQRWLLDLDGPSGSVWDCERFYPEGCRRFGMRQRTANGAFSCDGAVLFPS